MSERYKYIVIGAGVSGIYQIKRLIDLSVDAVLLEADDDIGGTWYRNRYPGARFDSESYTYGYSFSEELLQEWHWKERFSPQPENLRYLNFVVDKFDLRRHMRFGCRVNQLTWQADEGVWALTLESGEIIESTFVITGLGVLSVPTMPKFADADSFQGESYHTYWWPQEPVDLKGKKVGVIGTGATGIQVISEIASQVEELVVFQRRPNWSTPLNNSPISHEEMEAIRANYSDIFAQCAASPNGFVHVPDRRGFWNLSKEERTAFWDELYDQPGFALLAGNFPEIFFDEAANKEISEYVASRIRGRVNDPKIAEQLIPKDHGFGMQRLPLETRYFEVYNRDNVKLVNITETPIERFYPNGIRTSEQDFDLDLVVYATGFDAITGAFDRLKVIGENGLELGDKWRDGPKTHSGIMTQGFPNLLMIAGPQSISGSTNFPRAIELTVNWVTELIAHIEAEKFCYFSSDQAEEEAWQQEVVSAMERLLARRSQSWFTGYNSNIKDRDPGKVRYHAYFGGGPKYAAHLNQVAQQGYRGIKFESKIQQSS